MKIPVQFWGGDTNGIRKAVRTEKNILQTSAFLLSLFFSLSIDTEFHKRYLKTCFQLVAVSLHVGEGLGCLSLNIWANCRVDEKSKGLRDERRK